MAGKIYLVQHVSIAELEHRYKAEPDGIKRTHLQIIWLLAQGRTAKVVASVTGYSPSWISKILWRYNDFGLDFGLQALGDGRSDNPGARPLLDVRQQDQLNAILDDRPPDGGHWTGRQVAQVMTGLLGRLVAPQRGVEYLRRFDFTPQVPRPQHAEADLGAPEVFKKNSEPGSPNSGTNSRIARLKSGPWTSMGRRGPMLGSA
jgi:transposase